MLNYKKFYFFYSTKRSWPDYNDFKKPKIQTKYYILHFKHFHFVRHYALTAFVYAFLVSFSVFSQYRDNFNQLKDLYLNKTDFTAKPGSGNFSTLWNDPHKNAIDLSFLKISNESQSPSFIDKLIKIKHNDGFFILSEYTEVISEKNSKLKYRIMPNRFIANFQNKKITSKKSNDKNNVVKVKKRLLYRKN
ncbi:hypothetical protein BpHYR1_028172 [Brachionus plicatilis]|uniref:Uncharacterized protein n=1 Tax=Brachionus plicatilis TaxID=10195 RepID=A0A3M7QGG7_BRAPC|nr:hypothetical protein BpHYR1_028172 [Brachionus plicatilis]